MLKLQYVGDTVTYDVSFSIFNKNIVRISGDFPIKTNGFKLSRDGQIWNGDYSGYTTVYRTVPDGAYFSNDGSAYIPPEPQPEPEPYVPTLEEMQGAKVSEMNAIQQEAIAAGVNVTLTDGTVEHFTLTDHDQISLMGLQSQVMLGVEQIPWHTSDEAEHCKLYKNADMALITEAAMAYVTWHVTYFRDLRIYIRSLDSREAVEAISYGMEVPEGYRSEPLQAMMAAQSA